MVTNGLSKTMGLAKFSSNFTGPIVAKFSQSCLAVSIFFKVITRRTDLNVFLLFNEVVMYKFSLG